MQDGIFGILLLIAGLGLTFMGLRVFMLLLPIFGFISGFFLGSSLIASLMDAGFLETVLGWIVGLIVGFLFAVLSYLYWYVGAIIAAGSAGAILAMSLVAIFNAETEWIYWVAALIGGALFAFLALVVRLPVYMVIFSTAFSGATMVIASILLVFNQIDLANLQWGTWHAIDASWFWWLAAIVIAAIGIAVQLRRMAETPLPEERWVRADSRARRQAAVSSDAETRGYR